MAEQQLSTKQRVGFAAAPVALIAALVAALGTNDSAHEGRRYTPYYDSAGVLAVCAGITRPAVVKGKRYAARWCAARLMPDLPLKEAVKRITGAV